MNKNLGILKDLLSGGWLKNSFVSKYRNFLYFILLLAVLQISSRYNTERLIHEKESLLIELRDTKFDYIQIEKEVLNISRESKLANDSLIKSMGLRLPKTPPKRIIIEKM